VLARIVVASGIAGLAAAIVAEFLPDADGVLSRLVAVALPGSVAGVVLVVALAILRVRIWHLVRGPEEPRPPT
jgi:hypothetical protein